MILFDFDLILSVMLVLVGFRFCLIWPDWMCAVCCCFVVCVCAFVLLCDVFCI